MNVTVLARLIAELEVCDSDQLRRYVVVAEKKSVAEALLRVLRRLGANALITSVSGHLMDCDLMERFSKWRLEDIPEMFSPQNVRLVTSDERSYRRIRNLLAENGDGVLVVATDNDHEGELIGFEILRVYREVRGDGAEYRRMRFNSLEYDEIVHAWQNLEPDLNWGWVHKAQLRRVFDLLTGAAFTRLLTLSARRGGSGAGVISWGPVQSPCLKFIVEREKLIREFKPRKYWYVSCVLRYGDREFTAKTPELWDRASALRIYESISSSDTGRVASYVEERVSVARPLPARTDDSLRELVRITGQSSIKLMRVMEHLYQSGTLSYPRTETNRYPPGFDFLKRLRALSSSGIFNQELMEVSPRPRNGRLSDGAHPPIYPTAVYRWAGIERVVWEYFARRFIANAFLDDARIVQQRSTIHIAGFELFASGRYFEKRGFYEVFHYFAPKEDPIPKMGVGDMIGVAHVKLVEQQTQPPPRLSESELLKIMETNGLGTDATRPLYPALLLERGYIVRWQRRLKPTRLGEVLVETLSSVDERLVTPETRRTVEDYMGRVEKGEMQLDTALLSALNVYRPLLEKCLAETDKIGELLQNSTHNRDN
ncbi:MAG: type IA DNA topoisomerase [Nitrososphaerota archaeon]